MLGLTWLLIRMSWWMLGASIDLTVLLCTGGKRDPRIRKFL